MEFIGTCQSCAMPLAKSQDFGTNHDGSINNDYCHYCFTNGSFTNDTTMEEMIEICVPFVSNGMPYKNADEAREAMNEIFPTLKRWKIK